MHRNVQQIFLATILVALQVLLFDRLQLRGFLGGYVAPSVYIMFVLVAPVAISRIQLLLFSFVIGLVIDLFSGTLGMHAAAATFIGYLRPFILSRFYNKENDDASLRPSILNLGGRRFFYYGMVLSFSFHLVLFTLEVFSFSMFYLTVLRGLLSALASMLIISASDLLFLRKSMHYK